MHHVPARYHMQDATKFPRIEGRDESGISAPLAATIALAVGIAAGVAIMETVHERREIAMKEACASHQLPAYTAYALPTATGYQCLMVPNTAQPWSFSPNIIISK